MGPRPACRDEPAPEPYTQHCAGGSALGAYTRLRAKGVSTGRLNFGVSESTWGLGRGLGRARVQRRLGRRARQRLHPPHPDARADRVPPVAAHSPQLPRIRGAASRLLRRSPPLAGWPGGDPRCRRCDVILCGPGRLWRFALPRSPLRSEMNRVRVHEGFRAEVLKPQTSAQCAGSPAVYYLRSLR